MKRGEIIIYPTESSYAIGCRYDDTTTIRKIMKLKGRTDDRFTLIANSLQQVKQHFKLNRCAELLAMSYWPSALSIVVSDRFAIRVPDSKVAREVAKDVPMLATSLNISGEPPVFDLRNINHRFADIPRIDIGPLPKRPPSTVVECFRGGYVIYRSGAVKLI